MDNTNGTSDILYLDESKVLIHSYSINDTEELISFLVLIFEINENKFDVKNLYETDSSFRIMYDLLKGKCPLQILTEDHYVDRVYRDSFYLYFASKYKQYDRFCKRLFLFKELFEDKEFNDIPIEDLQRNFMGTIVVRPLGQGRIGRSLLNPFFFAPKDSCLRYAHYKVVLGGKELYIDAFPFSMQDTETTTCAEITIINMMDYFSRRYQNYSCALPSDIFRIIDRHGYERTLPTKGLRYSEISRVFNEMGFYPRLYFTETFTNKTQFMRNMHYYVESGIPVGIGFERVQTQELHAVTCIGHAKVNIDIETIRTVANLRAISNDYSNGEDLCVVDTADLINDYIFMDDGQTPYKKYTWKSNDSQEDDSCFINEDSSLKDEMLSGAVVPCMELKPKNIMVPLYKRMFLEAQDAFEVFMRNLIHHEVGIWDFIPDKDGKKQYGTEDNPLIVRIFLASSRHFRQVRLADMEDTSAAAMVYRNVPFPKFVWVCEIYTPEGYCKDYPSAIGEIVLDATASKTDANSVIIRHYFNNIAVCDYEDGSLLFDKSVKDCSNNDKGTKFYRMDVWREIKAYEHNLSKPKQTDVEHIESSNDAENNA